MANFISPTKRLKLSKATSTPISQKYGYGSDDTPDISSLEYEVATEDTVDSNVESSSSSAEISVKKRRIDKVEKFSWKGNWRFFKPSDESSIYFKLTSQPGDVDGVVSYVVTQLQSDLNEGIMLVLKLIIDSAGMNDFVLGNYDNTLGRNSPKIVDKLEEFLLENPVLSRRFISIKQTSQGRLLDDLLKEFCMGLVHSCCEKSILFENRFRSLFKFIRSMTESSYRIIHITGMKWVTLMLSSTITLSSDLLQINPNELETYFDFFFFIFHKNCPSLSNKDSNFCLFAIREILFWIDETPSLVSRPNFDIWKLLLQFVLNPERKVRLAALKALYEIVQTDFKVDEYIEQIIEVVGGRVRDIDIDVAVQAVDLLTFLLEKYYKNVNRIGQISIVRLIYESNSRLALAAGKWLTTFLKLYYPDPVDFMTNLTKVVTLRQEFLGKNVRLIEACIGLCPELTDWNLMIKLLLSSQNSKMIKVIILDFMIESIRIYLSGKSTAHEDSTIGGIEKNHQKVASIILPQWCKLRKLFKNVEMIELLLLIDFKQCLMHNFEEICEQIINHCIDWFQNELSKATLKKIANLFAKFLDDIDFNDYIKELINKFKDEYVNKLKYYLENTVEEVDKEFLTELQMVSYKVSILFEFIDLTESFKWSDFFELWNIKIETKNLKYLIACGKWYLIWCLSDYMKYQGEGKIDKMFLVNCSKSFINTCIHLIEENSYSSVNLMSFTCLTEYYIHLGGEFRKRRQFEDLLLHMEKDQVEIIVKFLTNTILRNKSVPLTNRQIHLANVVDMVYLKIIPVEYLSHILRYYYSHYADFGCIMDQMLTELKRINPAHSLIILATLSNVYNELLHKYNGAIDIRSDSVKFLSDLANSFANSPEIKKSQNCLMKFLHGAIYFALKERSNYEFLYFVRHFVKNLSSENKKDLLESFKARIPKDNPPSECILMFARYLQNK